MQKRLPFAALVVALLWVIVPVQCQYPPAGVYFALRDDIMNTISTELTNDIQNEVNTFTAAPPVNGNGGASTYSFFDFLFDVSMNEMSYTSLQDDFLTVNWSPLEFNIVFSYHVCSNSWPNPCEDGWVKVYTTDADVTLSATLEFDFDASVVFINATSVDLDFQEGDIEIYVQCTDTICWIPPSDISQAIADNFATAFQYTVAKSTDKIIAKYFQAISTFRNFNVKNFGTIVIEMVGDWYLIPDNSDTSGMLFAFDSLFSVDQDGSESYPPFFPGFAIPAPILQTPAAEVDIFITPYFFQGMVWAVGTLGMMDLTITPSMILSLSPVKLSSNDNFFQTAVPSLVNLPNLGITVRTTFLTAMPAFIDSQSVNIGINMTIAFDLSNSSYSLVNAWELSVQATPQLTFDVSVGTVGNSIDLISTIANISSAIGTVSTRVGPVADVIFEQLLQLLGAFVQIPDYQLTIPSALTVTAVTTPTLGSGYIAIPFDADFTVPFRSPSSPKESITIS